MRAAIVLAAGASRRFGRIDKLNARLGGTPLRDHAIRHALASGAKRVIVVTSHGGVGRGMGRRIHYVRAARHREGLSASLAAGLAALRPIEREVLIFLGDMPFASMPRGLRLRPGIDAIRPVVGGKPGHPMLVRAAAARTAIGGGDRGLARRLGRIGQVRGTAGNGFDIDTPSALSRARRMLRRRCPCRRSS
jgi:molybdenum cofactor cytidylyltransferase